MFGTIARLAVLRFMPRRLVPLLAAWEIVQLLRASRRRRSDPRAGVRTRTSAGRFRPR